MVKFLVVIMSAAISFIDIKQHRIPNRLTFTLTVVLLCDSLGTSSQELFVLLPVSLAFGLLCKFGAGDIKLFTALIVTSGTLLFDSVYLYGVVATSLLTLCLTRLHTCTKAGARSKSIPFAPSILLPFIALYLAI